MDLDNSLYQGWSNSEVMTEFIEQTEVPFVILRVDANTIIAHKNNVLVVPICPMGANLDVMTITRL